MVSVHLLERPKISKIDKGSRFYQAVYNRQVLMKSSHVSSMHLEPLDFCFLLEKNSSRHYK